MLKFECVSMETQRHYDPWEPTVAFERKELDCGYSGAYGKQIEFFLSATIGVVFYANQAQYSHAVEEAEKCIKQKLYEAPLCLISQLRAAILDHDEKRALELTFKLEKMIKGDE